MAQLRKPQIIKWLLPIGIAATPLILWKDLLDPAMTVRFLYLTLFGGGITGYLYFSSAQKLSTAISEIIHWRNPLFIAIVIWMLATALSLLVALQKSEGYVETARVIFFLLSYMWVAAWVKTDRENIVRLSIGFCLTGFLLCCFGVHDFYEAFPSLRANNIYYPMSGGMGNRNLLAIMISFCLPFHFIVFERFKSKAARIVLALNFLSGVSVVALTSSRVGWLGSATMLVIGIIAFFIAGYLDFKAGVAKKLMVGAAAFSIAIAVPVSILFFKNPSMSENLKQRVKSFYNFNSEKNYNTESIQERLDLWVKSIKLIKEHPMIGVGAGNWKFAYPEKGLRGRAETGHITFMQPHNDFIWVFAETGIIGGLAFTSLFAIAFVSFFERRGTILSEASTGIALLMGITMHAIASFFDFPKERPLILFTFAVILGIVTGLGENQKAQSISTKTFRSILLVMMTIGLLTALFWIIRMKSELNLKKAIAARQDGNLKGMKKYLEKINNSFFASDLMGTPVDWYRAEAAYSTGNQKDFKRYAASALKLNPYQLYNLYNLGSIYYNQGDKKSAIYYWEKAVSIAPRFTEAAVNLSAAYYNNNDLEKAAALLSKPEIDYSNETYGKIVISVLGKYVYRFSDSISNPEQQNALRQFSMNPEWLKNLQRRMAANNETPKEATLNELRR